jgi:predicted ArsR family transcriptional regulator
MKSTRGDERFWASTRGRIIQLLRRGSRTVTELAEALGLTDNAIRTQLTALERDGLARPSGTRPGTRKPNIIYGLTPEAERLFPKMYAPILRQLLDVLTERLPRKKLEEAVREVGHRMATEHRSAVRAERLEDRVIEAIALLGAGAVRANPSDMTAAWLFVVSIARWPSRWSATRSSVGSWRRCWPICWAYPCNSAAR